MVGPAPFAAETDQLKMVRNKDFAGHRT